MADTTARDSYSAAFHGGIPDSERQRLDLQSELFAPLAAWTFDALAIGPGGTLSSRLRTPTSSNVWHIACSIARIRRHAFHRQTGTGGYSGCLG